MLRNLNRVSQGHPSISGSASPENETETNVFLDFSLSSVFYAYLLVTINVLCNKILFSKISSEITTIPVGIIQQKSKSDSWRKKTELKSSRKNNFDFSHQNPGIPGTRDIKKTMKTHIVKQNVGRFWNDVIFMGESSICFNKASWNICIDFLWTF